MCYHGIVDNITIEADKMSNYFQKDEPPNKSYVEKKITASFGKGKEKAATEFNGNSRNNINDKLKAGEDSDWFIIHSTRSIPDKYRDNEMGGLAGFDLQELTLTGGFEKISFKNTNLQKSNLDSATFVGNNFAGTNFAEATLNGSEFQKVTFNDNNFSGVKFKNTEFYESTIIGVNLANAEFTGCTVFDDCELKNLTFTGENPVDFDGKITIKNSKIDGGDILFANFKALEEKALNELDESALLVIEGEETTFDNLDLSNNENNTKLAQNIQSGRIQLDDKSFENLLNFVGAENDELKSSLIQARESFLIGADDSMLATQYSKNNDGTYGELKAKGVAPSQETATKGDDETSPAKDIEISKELQEIANILSEHGCIGEKKQVKNLKFDAGKKPAKVNITGGFRDISWGYTYFLPQESTGNLTFNSGEFSDGKNVENLTQYTYKVSIGSNIAAINATVPVLPLKTDNNRIFNITSIGVNNRNDPYSFNVGLKNSTSIINKDKNQAVTASFGVNGGKSIFGVELNNGESFNITAKTRSVVTEVGYQLQMGIVSGGIATYASFNKSLLPTETSETISNNITYGGEANIRVALGHASIKLAGGITASTAREFHNFMGGNNIVGYNGAKLNVPKGQAGYFTATVGIGLSSFDRNINTRGW